MQNIYDKIFFVFFVYYKGTIYSSKDTQQFIRVNVYYCSNFSLLATFSEQNKDFFLDNYFILG